MHVLLLYFLYMYMNYCTEKKKTSAPASTAAVSLLAKNHKSVFTNDASLSSFAFVRLGSFVSFCVWVRG